MRVRVRGNVARRRRALYPPITDQLDALWKAINELTAGRPLRDPQAEAMRERINEIKRRLS